ncbi:hypothetical protein CKM354_000983000 [Cercospora kikuchii]|uniref:GH16 domain-containing protein n=1 Tax=Cercospora kikuchii TaxID=84275 RepID=A0A9P3CQB5_9PEZI|nr:uncharacterized protein CKM354_000983000 [Cercospora kikuchii]GIZ46716.1 hypothetical protein CKM354_000983000 [Cercospora kikuchii]
MFRLAESLSAVLLIAGSASAQREDGQFWPCNPIKNATGTCAPNPGLPTTKYEIDFTKVTSIPPEWTISNYATINFGPNGAEFTYNKRWDAPQLWTNFFILFGKVDVEMRIASGVGMISSAVLMSDDFDEIDFEFSGNNFGNPAWTAGVGQNNYFGKGLTGNYDRGSYFEVSRPQDTFHTYSFEWRKAFLNWELDGKVIRQFRYDQSSGDQGNYQYPQTPAKLQLGIWAGGDPSMDEGTKSWAGGETDVNGGPYTMYVRKVTIHNYNPAHAYNWTDQSGKWQSIQISQDKKAPVSNVTVTIKPPSMGTNSTSASVAGSDGKKTSTTKVVTYTSTYKVAGTSTVTGVGPTPQAAEKWVNWGGWNDGWWTTDADGKAEYVGGVA